METALKDLEPDVIQSLADNHGAFRSFLARRLPSKEVAEEILQQGLLKALQNKDSLENDESAVAWFYRILRNLLIDYYRSHESESRRNETFYRELIAGETTVTPASDELKAAVCQCVNRLLPALRASYADLIRRVDLESQSPEQVARELGITVNNLGVRLHRARVALRTSLERSCGACAEHACLECTCSQGVS